MVSVVCSCRRHDDASDLVQAVSAGFTWSLHASAALLPTTSQLQVAAAARAVRVFVYEPASAGVQPPLAAFAANSSVCKSTCQQKHHSVEVDLCNNAFGRMRPAKWAAAMQGHFWSNHDWGHDVSHQVCIDVHKRNRRLAWKS